MYLSFLLSTSWADNLGSAPDQRNVTQDVNQDVNFYVQEIKNTYKDVEYIEAKFVQKSNQMGMELEQTGKVFLAKPKNIRWEFKTPSEQLILSDGKELWVYTPAANQAILSEDMSQSNPIANLIDNLSEIDQYFSVQIIETPTIVSESIVTAKTKNNEERQERKEQKKEQKEQQKEQRREDKEQKKELKNKEGKGKKRKDGKSEVVSFEITPTDEDLAANVKQLVLTLDEDSYDVRSILIYDPMGGMVHLQLSDVTIEHTPTTEERSNKRSQRKNLFTFTPPEGTNVIKSNSFAPQ